MTNNSYPAVLWLQKVSVADNTFDEPDLENGE